MVRLYSSKFDSGTAPHLTNMQLIPTPIAGFKEDQVWVGPPTIQKAFISENSMTASHYDIVFSPGTVSPATEPLHKPSTERAMPSLPRLPELDRGMAWPLTDPDECHLFRNFEKNLAVWLDLCE